MDIWFFFFLNPSRLTLLSQHTNFVNVISNNLAVYGRQTNYIAIVHHNKESHQVLLSFCVQQGFVIWEGGVFFSIFIHTENEKVKKNTRLSPSFTDSI